MNIMNLSDNDIIKLFALGIEVSVIFFILPCIYYFFKKNEKFNWLKALGFGTLCLVIVHIILFCSFWMAINIGAEIPMLILAIIGMFLLLPKKQLTSLFLKKINKNG